jgi:hypothetical protein
MGQAQTLPDYQQGSTTHPTQEGYNKFKNSTTYLIYSHGTAANTKKVPEHTMVVHTGEICTTTLTSIDKVVQKRFSKPGNKLTFDVLSGSIDISSLPERKREFFQSIGHWIYPDVYMNKRHTYTTHDIDEGMLMGAYLLNKVTGAIETNEWLAEINDGMQSQYGLFTSDILRMLREHHAPTEPIVVVFISCSVINDEPSNRLYGVGSQIGTQGQRYTVRQFNERMPWNIKPQTYKTATGVRTRRVKHEVAYGEEPHNNANNVNRRYTERNTEGLNEWTRTAKTRRRRRESAVYPQFQIFMKDKNGSLAQHYDKTWGLVNFHDPQEVYNYIQTNPEFIQQIQKLKRVNAETTILIRMLDNSSGSLQELFLSLDSFEKRFGCTSGDGEEGTCSRVMRWVTGRSRKNRKGHGRRRTRKN